MSDTPETKTPTSLFNVMPNPYVDSFKPVVWEDVPPHLQGVLIVRSLSGQPLPDDLDIVLVQGCIEFVHADVETITVPEKTQDYNVLGPDAGPVVTPEHQYVRARIVMLDTAEILAAREHVFGSAEVSPLAADAPKED